MKLRLKSKIKCNWGEILYQMELNFIYMLNIQNHDDYAIKKSDTFFNGNILNCSD